MPVYFTLTLAQAALVSLQTARWTQLCLITVSRGMGISHARNLKPSCQRLRDRARPSNNNSERWLRGGQGRGPTTRA